jgi:hypothetical protein
VRRRRQGFLAQAREILQGQLPTSLKAQLLRQHLTQRNQVMGIQPRILQTLRGERSFGPVRFLMSLIQMNLKHLLQQRIQPQHGMPQKARRVLRIEQVPHPKTEIAKELPEIVGGRVKNFLDARVSKDRPQGLQIAERQRIDQIIGLGRGNLEQAYLLLIGVQAIRFGIHPYL